MTITEFCRKHNACAEGREWALENCQNMDEVWAKAKPEWLIWVATREGVLTDKEVRLFAVWCARQVQHLMADGRSIDALDVAERYANGNATLKELNEAWREVSEAIRDVARAAFRAVSDEAVAAAWVAYEAARTAREEGWRVGAAAWRAAEGAGDTVGEANRNATEAAQAEYLRQNCKPNFNPQKTKLDGKERNDNYENDNKRILSQAHGLL